VELIAPLFFFSNVLFALDGKNPPVHSTCPGVEGDLRVVNNLQLTEILKALAVKYGAGTVGVADLSAFEGIVTHPIDLLDDFTCAVSIGINLGRYDGYNGASESRAFSLLDKIAGILNDYIEKTGHCCVVVPPDQRVGKKKPLSMVGAISHKAVANASGIGWIGKSTLLINPRFGPRICLVTLLTDLPLVPDRPMDNKCGTCRRCIEACPAGAIADGTNETSLAPGGSLDGSKCGAWLDSQWRLGKICYDCMLACPWGNSDDDTKSDDNGMVQRLHNAWLGRQEGCSRLGHDCGRSRVLHYGQHIQVVQLCNSCYKTGINEHRQLARTLRNAGEN
jgi:epoxyqueuosine reductase QueG